MGKHMKKSLIVLTAILVSLCSLMSVSAAEVHAVKIASVVASQPPVFQFEFTSGMLDGSDPIDIGVRDSANGREEASSSVVYVADIRENDLELVFTVKLSNEANCKLAYTLSFNAGSFTVYRNNELGYLAPSATELKIASDISARNGVEAAVSAEDSNSIRMGFNGRKCTAGALATYVVKYEADATLDPSTYYTDISLEISSDF